MKRTALLIAGLFITLTSVFAQKSDEIGVFLGGSYYIGELNPTTHFGSLTRPALGVVYRHNLNMRLALAGDLIFGSVQGIDSRSTSFEQQKRNLSFRSPIYELGARAEFNFLEYKIGDDKYSFSPFIFLGVAMFNFKPEANLGNQWVSLQPLKTEGQSKAYMRTQISIPFGAGFRTNLAKRIGLVAEWGMRKTFTDYLDDVSTTYADPAVLYANGGPIAVALADRSATPNDVGRQRGNPRNKDWYSFAGLTLTFQLAGKPGHCYAYGM
ncbi:MAG TPA: DUF6089 family protein [Bacteroidia bacterium]|nr:DUF6089 family protein [Bacteroidia bacterium]